MKANIRHTETLCEIYLQMFFESENISNIHMSSWPEKLKLNKQINKKKFEKSIKAIDEIRKYKSENSISL
jgi:valyl-tRNA synthetase